MPSTCCWRAPERPARVTAATGRGRRVAGGLHGSVEALDTLLEPVAAAPAGAGVGLVFNGDFHWFDTDPDEFGYVHDTVLQSATCSR